MSRIICTILFVGFFPVAPGTLASFVALLIAYFIYSFGGFLLLLAFTVFSFIFGLYFISKYISEYHKPADPKEIVIDEVVGQWVTLLPSLSIIWLFNYFTWDSSMSFWLWSFIFFRLFDILKPWPVSWADNKHSAFGVMLDDVLAGLYASLAILTLSLYSNFGY
jgi:phosphatidylglycerophosphatase A